MSKSILGLLLFLFTATISRAEQPIFNISSADANPGETVEIDFRVDNFTNIISAQFSVNWNPAVLDFVAIKNLNGSVTGLSPANFNVQDFIDEGKFTFSWLEASLSPISIPDGSLFFTVEFTVAGGPCDNSNVAITNDPTEIEVSEPNEVLVGLQSNIGNVEVPGSGCIEDILLVGNSVTGACGSTTCVQFTVQNFTDVGAIEFSLAYNPSILQFNRIQNFAPLLAFGAGNTNLQSPGNIRVVWFNGNAENETLPDGTILFEVCFDVIGTGGQSSEITFGNNPNPMFSDIDGNLYPTTIIPAEITAQCALEGFALIADTMCTNPNGEICIPIKVNDFDDIIAFGFSLNWDSTVFEFNRLECLPGVIPGLDDSLFGTPDPNPDVDEGQLSVVWIDLSLQGVTVPDFSTIFCVCLTAVGPAGSSTPITFSGDPVLIEVQDAQDSIIVPALLHGRGEIKINCDNPCSISFTINPTMPDCPREANGSLDLSVDIGSCPGTPTYLWSYENRTTEDLLNVPAGTYSVTITVGTQVVVATGTISDPAPLGVSGIITNPVPAGASNGSVVLTVTGGMAPYTYQWSVAGQTNKDLINIPAGVYTVTVTDAKGCEFIPNAFIVGADIAASINNVTCPGLCNGSINLSPSFGTGPYTYSWNPPSTAQNLSNLCAGTYCVTITATTGGSRDTCFTITQPNPLIVFADISDDPDSNCEGAIDLNVTGGILPITYQWSNGATSQDIINLCANQYCVTITYGSSCTLDTCFIVAGDGIGIIINTLNYGNFETSCFGECDGEITTQVSGGAAPYTFQWSNNGGTNPDRDNLCAGTYTVTVTDAAGVTSVATEVITSPPQININATETFPTSSSSSDGMISLVVSGGLPGYTYQWSPVSGSTAVLTALPAGIYTVTVTDNNQCTETLTIPLFDERFGCYKANSIITPNDDGKNDVFIIFCAESIVNHLSIFNRHGGLVYETDNYVNNWTGFDGDGDPLPDGGYHWVFEYTDGGGRQAARGTVVILRTAD